MGIREGWRVFVAIAMVAVYMGCGDDTGSAPVDGDASVPADGSEVDGGGSSGQPTDGGGSDGNNTNGSSACALTYAGAGFCDDFDKGLNASWTPFGAGAAIAAAPAPNVSPPNALRAATPDTPDASAQARIARDVAAGTTEWTFEASVRVQSAGTNIGSPQPPIALQVNFPNAAGLMVFDLRPNQTAFCNGLGVPVGGDVAFAHGVWHRVKMKLAASGANIDLSCEVDGLSPQTGQATGATLPSAAEIRVGLFSFKGQGALEVLYDDVVFNSK